MTDVKPRLSLNRPHKDTPAPERVESTLTSTRGHTVNVAVYKSTSAEKERPRRTRFSDSQGGGRGSRSSFKERRHGGSRPFEGRREFEREEKAERAVSSPRKERPEGPSVSVDRSGPHPVRHFKKGVSVVSRGSETRAAAALCVTAIEEGRSLNEALPYYTRDLDVRDKAFVSEIVHGTLRHRRLLGATLQPLLTVKINEHYRPARNLLLTALYQLSFMRTPAHAVVAATVGASSLCDCRRFTATLNAVLRRFLREGAHLAKDVSPAVEESCPDWLYERLTEAYGQERTLEILRCSNDHPPLWLRVESSAISPQDFMSLLDRAGLPYRQSTLLPEAILLEEPLPVPDIPGFREGYFSVQDISAQLSAPLLADGLSPDASPAILDCCAAPGGKSAHLLDLLPHARLTALEKDPHRAASIEALHETVEKLEAAGNKDLILDVGTASIKDAYANAIEIRRAALKRHVHCGALAELARHVIGGSKLRNIAHSSQKRSGVTRFLGVFHHRIEIGLDCGKPRKISIHIPFGGSKRALQTLRQSVIAHAVNYAEVDDFRFPTHGGRNLFNGYAEHFRRRARVDILVRAVKGKHSSLATNSPLSLLPSSSRTGMFCRLGSALDSLPVVVRVCL